MSDNINHPPHYGGEHNPYEAIKVIEAWSLGFNLGNTVKYIARADHRNVPIEDLRKARWYLDREIAFREVIPLKPPCINHPDLASVTNLDNEDLCQACADAWVRGEGQFARDLDDEIPF